MYGKVHEFFTVKDQAYLKALNVIAGPHLAKIVVESPNIASEILKRRLIHGTTRILPLSKLRIWGFPRNRQGQKMNDVSVLSAAKNLVKNVRGARVHLPFELIEYQDEMGKLMKFVFQNYLVVSNMETGQLICDKMRIRCVTMEGEKIDMGTLTGGYRPDSKNMLKTCADFNKANKGYKTAQKELDQESVKHEQLQKKKEEMLRTQRELGDAEARIRDLQREAKNCKERMQPGREENLKALIKQGGQRIESMEENVKSKRGELERIEQKLRSNQSQAELEREQREMVEKTKQQIQVLEKKHHDLELEKVKLDKRLSADDEEVEELKATLEEEEQEIEKLREMVKNDGIGLRELREEMEMIEKKLGESHEKRKKLEIQKVEVATALNENKIKLGEIEEALENLGKRIDQNLEKIGNILQIKNFYLKLPRKNFYFYIQEDLESKFQIYLHNLNILKFYLFILKI